MERCIHCKPTQFSGAPVCELNDALCVEEIDEGKCPFKDLNGNIRVDEFASSCKVCDFGNPGGCDFIYCGTQNGKSVEACLIPPTPISMRKNPERPASIQVLVSEDNGGYRQFDIPISHCPCCGRKL